MDYPNFKQLVSEIRVGKRLPDSIYVHESVIESVPKTLSELVFKIADALKVADDDWNIIKFYSRDFRLSFLSYPGFEVDSYPRLQHSYTVDLSKLSLRKADYSDSENPPILHRKEIFVDDAYPLRQTFEEITREGEEIGLYENARAIGFQKNWERLVSKRGYFLNDEGRIKPKAEEYELVFEVNSKEVTEIERHRTAIDRNQLSQPMQVLARHDYLNGEWSILDYGCGKGDDLRELEAHGLDISGWDPVHNPEGELVASAIVNLGFVLNVIENRDERKDTLRRAWEYASTLLIVSVMIAGDSVIAQFRPYKDGVVTSRNTFQKYYAQSEFRSFLEYTLDEDAIAVGQGIFIIFKDKIEEQIFLLERQHVKRDWLQRTQKEVKAREPTLKKDIIDKNIELFTDFWEVSLDLGRIPANSEFEFSEQIRRIAGSHIKAHHVLLKHFGKNLFEESHIKRKEDLLVYFALGLFEKRKPKAQLPESLKRDVKAFYNSYPEALEIAKKSLFEVGRPNIVEEACVMAYKKIGCGELNAGHDYIFHIDYLGELPKELRIYVGCAAQLYGDMEHIQLVKVHTTSGKVSLMRYKNWESDTPLLVERIKIKMREQDVDFFDYTGKFTPTPLQNKVIFSKLK